MSQSMQYRDPGRPGFFRPHVGQASGSRASAGFGIAVGIGNGSSSTGLGDGFGAAVGAGRGGVAARGTGGGALGALPEPVRTVTVTFPTSRSSPLPTTDDVRVG